MARRLEIALELAAAGIPVFPCHTPISGRCSCGRGCTSPGKHPATKHGFRDSSTDPDQVRRWWSGGIDYNIGVTTGVVVDALDLDLDKPGAETSLETLLHKFPVLRECPRQHTGSGGLHVFFRAHAGVGIGTKAMPGVDWRGRGGYILFWPSRNMKGDYVYEGQVSDLLQAPPWPEDLVRLLAAPRPRPGPKNKSGVDVDAAATTVILGATADVRADRARSWLEDRAPSVSGDNGHGQLLSTASILRRGFVLPRDIVLDLLQPWNETCSPPWSRKELEHKLDQIDRHEPEPPLSSWVWPEPHHVPEPAYMRALMLGLRAPAKPHPRIHRIVNARAWADADTLAPGTVVAQLIHTIRGLGLRDADAVELYLICRASWLASGEPESRLWQSVTGTVHAIAST